MHCDNSVNIDNSLSDKVLSLVTVARSIITAVNVVHCLLLDKVLSVVISVNSEITAIRIVHTAVCYTKCCELS